MFSLVLKALITVILLYFLTLIQSTFWGVNLVLIFVFVLSFFEKRTKKIKFSYLSAFIGGFFLDVFSALPLGVQSLVLISLVFLTRKLIKNLRRRNIFWFTATFIIFLFAYNLIIGFLSFRELKFVLGASDVILAVIGFFFAKRAKKRIRGK